MKEGLEETRKAGMLREERKMGRNEKEEEAVEHKQSLAESRDKRRVGGGGEGVRGGSVVAAMPASPFREPSRVAW